MGEVSTPDASTEVKEAVARAAKGRGTNPEAYRLYPVARHFIDRSNREELAKAIDYLIQSLALDPGFAQGWASLGQAHALRAGRGWAVAAEGYEASRRAVERALALEPDLAEAHAHLGWVQIYRDRDWRGAQASYARALELAPGNTLALRGAGSLAYGLGHLDESIHLHERSVGQDPLSSAAHNVLGLALYRAERFAEAEQAYRKALELAPQRATTHGHLALALLARGQVAQALAEAAAEPALWNRLYTQAILHHALGNRAESNQALEDLIAAHGEDSAAQIAEVHGARGEVDAAFEWIERAYAQADPGLSEIKACAHMRSLHGDPRWGAVLKKLGFED
jgi:serine/threonine-protein kinase